MKKVVIHIGYGKTATTLFQNRLFPRHPQINYLGGMRRRNAESEHPVERRVYRLLRAIVAHDSCRFDEAYWRELYTSQVYPLLSEDRLNLISEEWLSLTPVALVRGDQGLVAERLHRIFGPDVVVLMVIRNQLDVLNSLYHSHAKVILQWYSRHCSWRHRYRLDRACFDRLLMQTEDYGILSRYKYSAPAARYRSLFGDNLFVRLYEDFSGDQLAFLGRLAENLGIDPAPLRGNLPAGRVKASNPRRGPARRVKEWAAGRLTREFFTSGDIFSGTYLGLRDAGDDAARRFMAEYYRRDNNVLAGLLDVNLSDYGYPH